MRFHPSSEQILMQDMVRGALGDSLPSARLHGLIDHGGDWDEQSWKALMDLELGGILVPEQFGGAGMGLVDAALVCESLGHGAAPGPVTSHILAGLAIALAADDEVKAIWLPQLVRGRLVATIAVSGGWLADSWTIDADIEAATISGVCPLVEGAGRADLIVVGTRGGGLAIVERSERVFVEPVKSTDRSRRLSTMRFDAAPATIIAAPGGLAADRLCTAALTLIAADALGGAERCLGLSLEHAKTRTQFGQPIGRFQALKHQLVAMALQVEPARALVWYAAYAFDAGLSDATRNAMLAKAHLADMFSAVARMAVQVHGGIGFTWEYDLSIWFRRSLFDFAIWGNPTLLRARAAAMMDW